MKSTRFATCLGALTAGLMWACTTGAQTCASPANWNPPPGGDSVSGTTCGGDTTAAGYCGGNLEAPGPAFVIQKTFDGDRTFTNITLTGGSGYDAVMYVSPTSDGCGTNAPCTATGDPGSPIGSADIPDGTYYIIITAATFDSPGACGTFTLSSDVPVTLQTFTVG